MFVTEKLNIISELIMQQGISPQLGNLLALHYVNLEATLLRAKVLREFSIDKVQYIAQSAIQTEQASLGYLFAPFILANLNQNVIYHSPATPTVLNILNRYYQAEHIPAVKTEDVLTALGLYLDLKTPDLNAVDFFYFSLIKALCRSDVSRIFLMTDLMIDQEKLAEIELYFGVSVHYIAIHNQDRIMDVQAFNMQKLLFKKKDDQYVALCGKFAQMNAQLLRCYGSYTEAQATHLVDDMFYSEHIYEKLSVYAEYMQTRLQHEISLNRVVISGVI